MADLAKMLAECRTEEERERVLEWERIGSLAIAREREHDRIASRLASARRWTIGIGLFVWVWLVGGAISAMAQGEGAYLPFAVAIAGAVTVVLVAIYRGRRSAAFAQLGGSPDEAARGRGRARDTWRQWLDVQDLAVGNGLLLVLLILLLAVAGWNWTLFAGGIAAMVLISASVAVGSWRNRS